MNDLTQRAAAFLREATPDDLLSLLRQVLEAPGNAVDVVCEDSGHRVLIRQVTEEVFVAVDIEKDVLLEGLRSTSDQVREYVLSNFAGYRLGRATGFGLEVEGYEVLPERE